MLYAYWLYCQGYMPKKENNSRIVFPPKSNYVANANNSTVSYCFIKQIAAPTQEIISTKTSVAS